MTLWTKQLDHAITPMPDGSTRVVVVHIVTENNPIVLINTYMPTEGSHDKQSSYEDLLDEVHEITQKYQSTCDIIWAGDHNASFYRKKPTTNDRLFRAFCKEDNYVPHPETEDTPTYHHFCGESKSRIDHVLSTSGKNILRTTSVDIRHHLNVGSHDAVIAEVAIIIPPVIKSPPGARPANPKPKWNKADTHLYRSLTEERINVLISTGGLDLPHQVLADRLQCILLLCAEESGANVCRTKSKRTSKLPWAPELKPLVAASKQLHFQWKVEGKPDGTDTYRRLKEAKKSLRSMQRHLAATSRQAQQKEIATAHHADKQLFYKLVRRQRESPKCSSPVINFKVPATTQIEGWATYFETLATPVSLPHYCEWYSNAMQLKMNLLQLQNPPALCDEIDDSTIEKHVRSLKHGKAADIHGLTAEHLQLAAPQVIQVLTKIANDSFTKQQMPSLLKPGKATPIHKKGKSVNDPDGYRRITVAPIIGRIVEREQLAQMRTQLKGQHSKLQFGFTQGSSSSNCALVITEAIAEAKDRSIPLNIVFLDAKKAFDVVNHTSLLTSLHQQGVTGPTWGLFSDMYTNVTSCICSEGRLSREITERQGIRQGADTSPEAFKARGNDMLKTASEQPDAFHIGCTSVGAPTCADDTCMISTTPCGAQTLINIAQEDASKERYEFSQKKTRVMHVGANAGSQTPTVLLNGEPILESSTETHLGIVRSADTKSTIAVKEKIKIGRRTAYALIGAGLHGLNGLTPSICKSLIDVYVTPATLHGLESLRLNDTQYELLEAHHRKLIRQIQHLPISSAIPSIYLLLGAPPLEAQLHQRVLTFFAAILRRPESVECEILVRQLAVKSLDSNSWTVMLRNLLYQYHLPSAHNLVASTPSKQFWKITVRSAILRHWEDKMKEDAAEMSSLSYLNLSKCQFGRPHPVWENISSPTEVRMATVKAKLLVQRYPLTSLRCAGNRYNTPCPLCHGPVETIPHFLRHCCTLDKVRAPYTRKLQAALDGAALQSPEEDSDTLFTKMVLDPSWFSDDPALEDLTRRMCYALHNERAVLVGARTFGKIPAIL